jgi:hypothetical protein
MRDDILINDTTVKWLVTKLADTQSTPAIYHPLAYIAPSHGQLTMQEYIKMKGLHTYNLLSQHYKTNRHAGHIHNRCPQVCVALFGCYPDLDDCN